MKFVIEGPTTEACLRGLADWYRSLANRKKAERDAKRNTSQRVIELDTREISTLLLVERHLRSVEFHIGTSDFTIHPPANTEAPTTPKETP